MRPRLSATTGRRDMAKVDLTEAFTPDLTEAEGAWTPDEIITLLRFRDLLKQCAEEEVPRLRLVHSAVEPKMVPLLKIPRRRRP
jgi:hypothetical protein